MELAAPWGPTAGVTSCPMGWSGDAELGCEPPAIDACAAGRYPSVGRCVPTVECAAIERVAVPDGATVRYVTAAGSDDGDGSLARPYATVRRALEGAPSGVWLVLGEGSYAAAVTADRAINIAGVCAERVRLTGDSAAPVVSASASATVVLRGVTLTGRDERGVVVASGGASVRMEDSVIDGGVGYGLYASGASTSVTVVRSAVRAMRARADGLRGRSVHGVAGARVTVDASHIGDGTNVGVAVEGRGATGTVTDTVIERVRAAPAQEQGFAVSGDEGATLSVERSVLREIRGIAVYTRGGTVNVRRSLIARIDQPAPGQEGCAVYVNAAGRVVIEESTLRSMDASAALVRDVGSSFALRTSVLREVGAALTERESLAIVAGNSTVELDRVRASDIDFGLLGAFESTVSARGLRLLRVGRRSPIVDSSAAIFSNHSELSVSDVVAESHRGMFAILTDVDRDVSFERARIRFADASSEASFGALSAESVSATLRVRDVLIERCPSVACVLLSSGAVELESVWMRDFSSGQEPAPGALVVGEASVTARGLVVEGIDGPAITVFPRGRLTLEGSRVSVVGTRRTTAITAGSEATLEARALTVTGATNASVGLLGASAVIEDLRSDSAMGEGTVGVRAARAGSLVLRRAVINGGAAFGVVGVERANVEASDVLIDLARAQRTSWAVAALDGSTVALDRVVVQGASTALTSVGAGSTLRGRDVFVDSLVALEGESNAAVIAQLSGRIALDRVSVTRAAGAAYATLSDTAMESSLALVDAYAGDLTLGRVSSSRPEERSNVGLFVRSSSAVRCERCTLRGSSYGFMVRRGALSIVDGAISESLDAAGLLDSDTPPPSLTRVGMHGNARNEVLSGALPDVSFALPSDVP